MRKKCIFTALLATAALSLTMAKANPAIPIKDITAAKLGIPEEDFVSPELAIKSAIFEICHNEGGDFTAVIFPYAIRHIDNYNPPFYTYEVSVFEGSNPDLSHDDIYTYFAEKASNSEITLTDRGWLVDGKKDWQGDVKEDHTLPFGKPVAAWHILATKQWPLNVYTGSGDIGIFTSGMAFTDAVAGKIMGDTRGAAVEPVVQNDFVGVSYKTGRGFCVVELFNFNDSQCGYYRDEASYNQYLDSVLTKTEISFNSKEQIEKTWKWIDENIPDGKTIHVKQGELANKYNKDF